MKDIAIPVERTKEAVSFGVTIEGHIGVTIPVRIQGELLGESTVIIPAATLEKLYLASQRALLDKPTIVH